MVETLSLEDGKYVLTFDAGKLTATRHGEPWRDLSGDKLVYLLFEHARAGREKAIALCLDEVDTNRRLAKGQLLTAAGKDIYNAMAAGAHNCAVALARDDDET